MVPSLPSPFSPLLAQKLDCRPEYYDAVEGGAASGLLLLLRGGPDGNRTAADLVIGAAHWTKESAVTRTFFFFWF